MPISKLCFAVTPVMPITFDASLSYYETLMKVVGSQNDVIEEVNQQETEIDQIQADITQIQGDIAKHESEIERIQADIGEVEDDISTMQPTLNDTAANLTAMNFNYTPAYTNLKITLGENGQISWAQQNTLILIPANAKSGNGLGYSVNSGSVTVGKSQRLYLYLLTNGTSNSQIVTSNNPPLTINRDIQPAYPNYFALGFIDGFNSLFIPYACFYINDKWTYPYENLNNTTLLNNLDTTVDNHTTQISGISSQLTTTTNTANTALTKSENANVNASIALSTANDASTVASSANAKAQDVQSDVDDNVKPKIQNLTAKWMATNSHYPIIDNIVTGFNDTIFYIDGAIKGNQTLSIKVWSVNGWVTITENQLSIVLTTPTANSRPMVIIDFNDNSIKSVAGPPDNDYVVLAYTKWFQLSSTGHWAWISNIPMYNQETGEIIGAGGVITGA